MASNENRIDARDWSLLGLLSVLWGGSFFFNGVVLRELPPLTLVLLRVTLAAVILLPLLWVYRIRFPRGISGWKPFFAMGLLNNVLPFSLIVPWTSAADKPVARSIPRIPAERVGLKAAPPGHDSTPTGDRRIPRTGLLRGGVRRLGSGRAGCGR